MEWYLSIEYDPLDVKKKGSPSRFHSQGAKVNACTHSTSRNVRTKRIMASVKKGRNQKRRRRGAGRRVREEKEG